MSYTQEQMDEVRAWVHEEQRCVTTQTVSLAMGLPRSVAASLLSDLSKKAGEHTYECTKCSLSQHIGTTVIQLRKSIISPEDMDVDEASTIYSLALCQTETVHTAHEKDMDRFRDLLKEDDSTNTTMALEPTLHQHLVNSSFSKTRTSAQASQEERLSGRVVGAPHILVAAAAAISSKSAKKPARKATTAANFFAKNESPTKKQKKQVSERTSETVKPQKKESTKKQPQKKELQKKPPAKKQAPTEAMKVDDDSDASTIDFSQEEKENSVNGKKENTKIGNADDFVGDEDEDDDFLESERQRMGRNATKPKKKPQRKPTMLKEDVEEEEIVPKVHGAMDAFAQHQEKQPAEKHHKRRKRLVDKTTMDANGYLHTETQAVWEDVSDEEEPVVKETVIKAPVKSTKNMKQGSLMGFFMKK